MTETLRPETPQHLLDLIRWAAADGEPLEIVSGGSKTTFGRPGESTRRLDLGAFAGITAYEPAELVLTAGAATPLAEIERTMAEHGQRFAFEPPDLAPLLEGADPLAAANARRGTLGGVIACNLAGPRRIQAGGARDHVLGFHGISGRGERFKSGGRVVKNVTGFDLSKLISGSFGTLAVVSELTVRALPAPEETRTILVLGCTDAEAVRAMTAALQTPADVSGAAHLPAEIAARSRVPAVGGAGAAVTAIRIEGPTPSVEARGEALLRVLAAFGDLHRLDRQDSLALWQEIRDVRFFAGDRQRQVWRLSVPPAAGAAVVEALRATLDGEVFYDWGGGLIWLALPPAEDASHGRVRAAVAGTGGHATLIRADAAVRAGTAVFQPQPEALAALTRRVKTGFDPHLILNRGRMYADL